MKVMTVQGRPLASARRRSMAGQAIVIIALALTAMIGGIGIAVDIGMGYLYNSAAERAAAAAALSGVIFMPAQFSSGSAIPLGSGNDATDRAINEARRNGFDLNDTANQVAVQPSQVTGHPNQLRVTVSRLAPVFFMQIFGFQPYRVARTAIAAYLPPISLGQPGYQLGSSVSQMGSSGAPFFLRTEGWATDRQQGDAFTPNPTGGGLGPSSDVHAISYQAGSEPRDTNLSDRGGYNFRIVIPSGSDGLVQIYNAAFSPDGGNGTANYCENDNANPAARACNATRGNYYLHEDDGGPFSYGNVQNYATMRYTLYAVNNVFIRSSDVMVAQMTVRPIDARSWNQSSSQYVNVNTGATITQLYTGGAPSNMLIYHNWVDAASYAGLQDGGLVSLLKGPQWNTYYQGGALVPGIYRLRVDTLAHDGSVPSGSNQAGAHKGYGVRVVNADVNRTPCTVCTMTAWDDLGIYTPISINSGGSFAIKIFQLGPEYAGLTVNVDIYDPGDISSTSGKVVLNVLDPSGAAASSPQGVNIYDLGVQRSNLNTGQYSVIASAQNGNTVASFTATDTSNGTTRNGHWVHLEIPIPSSYNPPGGSDWWSLQYVAGPGTTATDTVTVAVGLKGGPVHLVG